MGSAQRECLDWVLIVGKRHLEAVLRVYVEHYNGHRLHPGLDLSPLYQGHPSSLAAAVAPADCWAPADCPAGSPQGV